jgi:hypothetical protein
MYVNRAKKVSQLSKQEKNTANAHKDNEIDKSYQLEVKPFIYSGPETETKTAQYTEIDGDILIECEEKVVEVMDIPIQGCEVNIRGDSEENED